MDPGDADREALENRVAELEETVSKMLPDRRGVLKGLGAAAVGGAAVGGATGGASGQSAAGQVGTESEPVDVEGAQGNFDSVSTDKANAGTRWAAGDESSGRSVLVSSEHKDIYVAPEGSGDGTSQSEPTDLFDALSKIPKMVHHQIRLHFDYGTYDFDGDFPQLATVLVNGRSYSDDAACLELLGHDSGNDYYDDTKSVSDMVLDGESDGNDFTITAVRGTEEDLLTGFTFTHRVQFYDCYATLSNCRFEGAAGADDTMLGGHGGKVLIRDSDFVGQGDNLAMNVNDLGRWSISNCTASGLEKGVYALEGYVNIRNSDDLVDAGIEAYRSQILAGTQNIRTDLDGRLLAENRLKIEDTDDTPEQIVIDSPSAIKAIVFQDGEGNYLARVGYNESQGEFAFRDDSYDRLATLDDSTGDLSVRGTVNENVTF